MGICLQARDNDFCSVNYFIISSLGHVLPHGLSRFILRLFVFGYPALPVIPIFGRFCLRCSNITPFDPIARNQTSLAQVASCCHPGRCSCLGVTGKKHEGNNQRSQGTNGAYVSTRKKPWLFLQVFFLFSGFVACVQSTWTTKTCILQPVTVTIKLQPVLVRFSAKNLSSPGPFYQDHGMVKVVESSDMCLSQTFQRSIQENSWTWQTKG